MTYCIYFFNTNNNFFEVCINVNLSTMFIDISHVDRYEHQNIFSKWALCPSGPTKSPSFSQFWSYLLLDDCW